MKFKYVSILLVSFCVFSCTLYAGDVTVDPAGGGNHTTIRAAINNTSVTTGDTIWLVDAVFSGNGNSGIDFNGKAITVRSISDTPENCIIICGNDLAGFIFHNGETSTSAVRGVTIRYDGNATGGGIYCYNASSPKIENCIIQGSKWEYGGGIFCDYSAPIITNCIITDNTVDYHGGGIYCTYASPIITNCTFSGNTSGLYGGGLSITEGNPIIVNSIFWNNQAPNGNNIAVMAGSVPADFCLFEDGTCPPGVSCTACIFATDPDFIGGTPFNYHIASSSQCIDQGTDDTVTYPYLPYDDIDSETRPNGTTYDIGADEFYNPTPTPTITPTPTSTPTPTATPTNTPCPDIYVQADGSGDYATVQDAIDAACTGATIWLSNGTYTGDGNRALDFNGKAITVRSSSYDPAACIIDCQHYARGFNFQNNESATSILRDITIRNGEYYNGASGGGIYCNGSSPSIINCIIVSCESDGSGAGIYCTSAASPTITGCTLSNNVTSWYGGGIYCGSGSSPEITDCTFNDNTATNYSGGGLCCTASSPNLINCSFTDNESEEYGAGIACTDGSAPTIDTCTFNTNHAHGVGGAISSSGSSPTIRNCTITGNDASDSGGGVYCFSSPSLILDNCTFTGNDSWNYYGGGIYISSSSPTISNCTFSQNHADSKGGGIACRNASPDIKNCTIQDNDSYESGGGIYCYSSSSPAIINCFIEGNEANSYYGGGIHCESSSPTIVNSTLHDNTAYYRGGGVYCTGSSPQFINTIFWSNQIGAATGEGPEIYVDSGSPTADYCLFESSVCPDNVTCDACLYNQNPNFIGGSPFDCHLNTGSPCIDQGTGDTATHPGIPVDDIDGEIRPMGTQYDIGADEYYVCNPTGVTISADGLGDYPTIQSAIHHVCDSTTIWLADGTYTGIGNRDITFQGKPITIRSVSDDPTACIIDCQGISHAFLFNSGESANSILRGVTITNGYRSTGGGLGCSNSSSPSITNCIITGNTVTHYGGGIYCSYHCSPRITNCIIQGNSADFGGGIGCGFTSNPKIVNCVITGNMVTTDGGGIHTSNSSPAIINTIVWDNTADNINDEINVYLGSPWADCSLIGDTSCPPDLSCTDCLFDLDPLFVGIGDYHLTLDSPCLDTGSEAGAYSYLPLEDMDGETRPMGARYDIGVDEVACTNNGDVDGSGTITAGDAQTAFYIVLGLHTPTYLEECAADCDGSGSITAGDAQIIFFKVLGLDDCVDPV